MGFLGALAGIGGGLQATLPRLQAKREAEQAAQQQAQALQQQEQQQRAINQALAQARMSGDFETVAKIAQFTGTPEHVQLAMSMKQEAAQKAQPQVRAPLDFGTIQKAGDTLGPQAAGQEAERQTLADPVFQKDFLSKLGEGPFAGVLTGQSNLERPIKDVVAERFQQKEDAAALPESSTLTPEDQISKLVQAGQYAEAANLARQNGYIALAQGYEKRATATPVIDPETAKSMSSLRKEWRDTQKDFLKIRDAYVRMLKSGTNPSPAGDLALIFNYMKMLDPGSTVREGEFATAQNSAGVPERIRAEWNRLVSGERLGPDQRKDFLSRSRSLFEGTLSTHLLDRDSFVEIAEGSGYNVDLAVPDFSGRDVLAPLEENLNKITTGAIKYNPETGVWE